MVDEAKTDYPNMVNFLSTIKNVEQSTPNDQELGSLIRNVLNEFENK